MTWGSNYTLCWQKLLGLYSLLVCTNANTVWKIITISLALLYKFTLNYHLRMWRGIRQVEVLQTALLPLYWKVQYKGYLSREHYPENPSLQWTDLSFQLFLKSLTMLYTGSSHDLGYDTHKNNYPGRKSCQDPTTGSCKKFQDPRQDPRQDPTRIL